MKCNTCGGKAVFQMRQHKLALCGEHYLEWLPQQVERFIKKYEMFWRGQRLLVAVSGGKDSLSLWDILNRLGYQADGLYIGLGIDGGIGYSETSQVLSEQFAEANGLKLIVESVPELYGAGIPQIAERSHRGKSKPCSVCGVSKRHIMNRVAREGGYEVLLTGHNLDDETSVLMSNTLNWQSSYLSRQGPVLEADRPGLVRKCKPLCRISEREMAAYALLRGINYIYEECPHAVGANTIYYKEMLNKLEADRPGAKLIFYLEFLRAKEQGMFPMDKTPRIENIHACPTCGQPTSAPDQCAFCCLINP